MSDYCKGSHFVHKTNWKKVSHFRKISFISQLVFNPKRIRPFSITYAFFLSLHLYSFPKLMASIKSCLCLCRPSFVTQMYTQIGQIALCSNFLPVFVFTPCLRTLGIVSQWKVENYIWWCWKCRKYGVGITYAGN